MAVSIADMQSRVTDLADEAFAAFCEDVSSMFGADVQCRREHVGLEAVADLRRRFKKLAAVHQVQATGLLDGTFCLLFDQGGLFVLSGVIVMLPAARVLEQVRAGQIDDAENLTDAAREVGNLLVGSWDRTFREGCDEHKHFAKSSTFIGKPWDHLDEIALAADGQVLLAVYEMTVDSYPSFQCAALLPQTLFGEDTEPAVEPQSPPHSPARQAPDEPAPKSRVTEPIETPQRASDAPDIEPHEQAAEGPDTPDDWEGPLPMDEPAESPEEPGEPQVLPAGVIVDDEPTAVPVDAAGTPDAKGQGHENLENAYGILSDERAAALIDEIFAEHEVCPSDTSLHDLLNLSAREIMSREVPWCDPDDSVQDVLTAMQKHNAGYVLIGRGGTLQGLVSNSNILGAISPYLRPAFARWRRAEDDATLNIKIKWVMTHPVRTVTPDVSLATMIENLRRYGGRCLPVMDAQGKIQGLVTVFDMLLRVLEADRSSSWQGRPPQAPPLMS